MSRARTLTPEQNQRRARRYELWAERDAIERRYAADLVRLAEIRCALAELAEEPRGG